MNIVHNDVVCPARNVINLASQAAFIYRNLERKLDSTKLLALFVGLNGAVTANSNKVCIVSLGFSIDRAFSLTTEVYVVGKQTSYMKLRVVFNASCSSFNG